MSADGKTVVFVCECGPIIRDLVDLDALSAHAASLQDVGAVERHATLCSPDGRVWLTEKLREHAGMRPVFAACSPREHAETLGKACEDAGVNPYLAGRANIREQCAWVTSDKDAATRKASHLLDAAVARALRNEPLTAPEIECDTGILVIGAGVAGMTAALLAADSGRQVTLVEREPAVGGTVVKLAELYPDMDCAPCLVEPLMDRVLHHPGIEVLLQSEIDELLGYLGNYTAHIRVNPRHVDIDGCYGCRTCSSVCPVEVPDPVDAGMSVRKAVHIPFAGALPNASVVDEASCLHFNGGECDACVAACAFGAIDLSTPAQVVERRVGGVIIATGSQLHTAGTVWDHPSVITTYGMERLLNPDGPTGGEVRLPEGQPPATIAFVHCAAEDGTAPCDTCSNTCCLTIAKLQHQVAEKLPDTRLIGFRFDDVLGGDHRKGLTLGTHRPAKLESVWLSGGDSLAVEPNGTGAAVRYVAAGAEHRLDVDLVVMAAPHTAPAAAIESASRIGVDTDSRGFVLAANQRLRTFCSRVDGIFLAGSAQSPKGVDECSAQGAAAAGAALSALVDGKTLIREAATAIVNEDLCGGCALCVLTCPYKAITFDSDKRHAVINELLCHGCGTCAAACPSSAITARHFSDAQITAEIGALAGGEVRCG